MFLEENEWDLCINPGGLHKRRTGESVPRSHVLMIDFDRVRRIFQQCRDFLLAYKEGDSEYDRGTRSMAHRDESLVHSLSVAVEYTSV